ncbi:MAG: M20 family metallopeptidase [Chloroflexi bacterium]|nr:M20 family metallopeptidase [Chloroflexota bacterium]
MPYLFEHDFHARLPQMIKLLREMVEIETPTHDKSAVDRLGLYLRNKGNMLNADLRTHNQDMTGNHITLYWGSGNRDILLLTHMDTVYPMGTLQTMPWRQDDEKIFGPGVFDMKAGIAIVLSAVAALQDKGNLPERGITLLCTSDEETGSASSRELIESMARTHKLVLVLEPGLPNGELKTWRKGVGRFQIETTGVAAHAGASHTSGVNAILEMAYQMIELSKLPQIAEGISLNLGRVRGGTRTNVVAENCTCIIDVRVKVSEHQEIIEKAIRHREPILSGSKINVTGSWNRPPMQRTPLIQKTFARAKAIAKKIDMDLEEGGTGGASDANFVAALGIPVLDGLGAVGGGAHSREEHIRITSLAQRAALLAALITDW